MASSLTTVKDLMHIYKSQRFKLGQRGPIYFKEADYGNMFIFYKYIAPFISNFNLTQKHVNVHVYIHNCIINLKSSLIEIVCEPGSFER